MSLPPIPGSRPPLSPTVATVTWLLLVLPICAGSAATAQAAELPPSFSDLFSDSIAYLEVPDGSRLTVTFVAHRYQLENAVVDMFAQDGSRHARLEFDCGSPEAIAAATGTTKSVDLPEGGTYKLVAYGPRFIYDLALEGPVGDWGLVVLGAPHLTPFRLVERGDAHDLYVRAAGDFTLLAGGEWSESPVRHNRLTVFDAGGVEHGRMNIASNVEPEAFESSIDVAAPDAEEAFWRVHVEDDSDGATPGAIGVWTSDAEYDHPMGPASLVAPAPEYHFVPEFDERELRVSIGSPTGRRLRPGTAGLANRFSDPDDPIYAETLSRFAELELTTIKHYTGWYWREGSPRERRNDNADPSHIDWSGFNFGPLETRMTFMRRIGVRPLLCLDWANPYGVTVDFVGPPDTWGPGEIAEYAEFAEAVVTYAVAPDLVDPPVAREPFDIAGIQPMGEPNLTTRGSRNPGTERDLILDQYVRIARAVVERLRQHPDPRVSGVKVFSPGVTEDIWGGSQRARWIGRMVDELPGELAVVGYDPYSKFFLEELRNYRSDVGAIRRLLEDARSEAEIGFLEFGIHGGPPTFDNIYGSRNSQLYLFGAIANAANAGLTYPYYFSTNDALSLNHKGLMGSSPEPLPPYTRFRTLDRKPQFHAMTAVTDIARGEVLEVEIGGDQLDVLASYDGDTYRVGVQNRYEAPTLVQLNVGEVCEWELAEMGDEGLKGVVPVVTYGEVQLIEAAPWTLYYAECHRLPDRPSAAYVPLAER